MDAKELTKKVIDQENRIFQVEKKCEYLEMEFQKLRLLMDDMKIDVQMLQKR